MFFYDYCHSKQWWMGARDSVSQCQFWNSLNFLPMKRAWLSIMKEIGINHFSTGLNESKKKDGKSKEEEKNRTFGNFKKKNQRRNNAEKEKYKNKAEEEINRIFGTFSTKKTSIKHFIFIWAISILSTAKKEPNKKKLHRNYFYTLKILFQLN